MTIFIDIIGSMVVQGMIVIALLNLTANLHDSLFQKAAEVGIKQKLASASLILSNDIMIAGYNSSSTVFSIADTNKVSFPADTDDNGTVETVNYYLGSSYGADGHRSLFRKVGSGTALEIARDIDTLMFTYFDSTGAKLSYGTNVSRIKSINIRIRAESPDPLLDVLNVDDSKKYLTTFWERRIFPFNLNNQ